MKNSPLQQLHQAEADIAALNTEFRGMADAGRIIPLTFDQLGEFLARYRAVHVELADAKLARMLEAIADTGVKCVRG